MITMSNSSNIGSNGVTPVTILGSATLDGHMDLIVQVSTQQALQFASSDVRADLERQLTSGVKIKGSNSVRIIQ